MQRVEILLLQVMIRRNFIIQNDMDINISLKMRILRNLWIKRLKKVLEMTGHFMNLKMVKIDIPRKKLTDSEAINKG